MTCLFGRIQVELNSGSSISDLYVAWGPDVKYPRSLALCIRRTLDLSVKIHVKSVSYTREITVPFCRPSSLFSFLVLYPPLCLCTLSSFVFSLPSCLFTLSFLVFCPPSCFSTLSFLVLSPPPWLCPLSFLVFPLSSCLLIGSLHCYVISFKIYCLNP